MGISKKTSLSDHKKWEIMFNSLKQMLRKQAEQLNSLIEQRTYLQQRIQLQFERWKSDVHMFEDVLSQMRRQLSLSVLGRSVEISKAEFLVASKQRSALFNQLKFEHAQSDLDDFIAWFDILSHRSPDNENMNISFDGLYESFKEKVGSPSSSKEGSKRHFELKKELAILKRDYEKLSVKHKSDMTALQDENTFVWNQYKAMERSYTNQLQNKNDEINRASGNILSLLTNLEQLQSAGIEKDETVAMLRANVVELGDAGNRKDEEISKLSKELELLKSKITDITSERSISALKGKRVRGKQQLSVLDEDVTSAQLKVTISTLRAKVSELEAEASKKSEEISILSKEIMLLRSNSSADTPLLRGWNNEPSFSMSRGRGNGRVRDIASEEEKTPSTQLENTYATVRDKISWSEGETSQKNGEISALSKKLYLLRSKSPAETPALRRCSAQPSFSRSRRRESGKDPEGGALKEETSAELVSVQGVRRSKRKQAEIINIEDTPRLFTSQFKIPKLRSRSPRGR
ncbi:uncharacterized protein LOC130798973 [Amaranthus tricolor]|uniref:uncharacterized protein LOC130798973 n=1 Tax=Amaranthus tricolor TaxID=29722 RepID=UPI00258EF3EA|nr:uncharacterized protein LOC130798973 [Amaranthus tricolor]